MRKFIVALTAVAALSAVAIQPAQARDNHVAPIIAGAAIGAVLGVLISNSQRDVEYAPPVVYSPQPVYSEPQVVYEPQRYPVYSRPQVVYAPQPIYRPQPVYAPSPRVVYEPRWQGHGRYYGEGYRRDYRYARHGY
jgi:hypothetical protein